MDNLKVLLVDDELEFVSTLAERLEMRNFVVSTANNGEKAIESVAAEPPDIVILDIMMPGMSGLAVLKRIREERPNMPVILLTGMGAGCAVADGMDHGAFDCLTKPINIEDLIDKIGKAVAPAGKRV